MLNDLQHIPHQPSSSLLAYHIDHDHSVPSNPRLVCVHVAIVRQFCWTVFLTQVITMLKEVRSEVHVCNSPPVKLQPVMQ